MELTETTTNHEDHEVHPTSNNDLHRVNDQSDSENTDKDASIAQRGNVSVSIQAFS